MSLITVPFEDYYNELVSRPYTVENELLDLRRDEVSTRKEIKQKAEAELADVQHIIGVWIADKKYYHSGDVPWMSRNALMIYKKQREVWFPKTLPRQVVPGKKKGFPHTAIQKLCEEEAEIYHWIRCIEAKCFEKLTKEFSDSLYRLVCVDQLLEKDMRIRKRFIQELIEDQAALRKRFFLTAPPDFFRLIAVQRYGKSKDKTAIMDREPTIEELEHIERKKIQENEQNAFKEILEYIQEMHDTQSFIVRHNEIVERQRIVQLSFDVLYPSISKCCYESFGAAWHHTPAVFLHVAPENRFSAMRQLCFDKISVIFEKIKEPVFPEYEIPPAMEVNAESTPGVVEDPRASLSESRPSEKDETEEGGSEKPEQDQNSKSEGETERKSSKRSDANLGVRFLEPGEEAAVSNQDTQPICVIDEVEGTKPKQSSLTVKFSCDSVGKPMEETRRPSFQDSTQSGKGIEFVSIGSDRVISSTSSVH